MTVESVSVAQKSVREEIRLEPSGRKQRLWRDGSMAIFNIYL